MLLWQLYKKNLVSYIFHFYFLCPIICGYFDEYIQEHNNCQSNILCIEEFLNIILEIECHRVILET
jgi:hypothetical protein